VGVLDVETAKKLLTLYFNRSSALPESKTSLTICDASTNDLAFLVCQSTKLADKTSPS
jgi:hypothetical protein